MYKALEKYFKDATEYVSEILMISKIYSCPIFLFSLVRVNLLSHTSLAMLQPGNVAKSEKANS